MYRQWTRGGGKFILEILCVHEDTRPREVTAVNRPLRVPAYQPAQCVIHIIVLIV